MKESKMKALEKMKTPDFPASLNHLPSGMAIELVKRSLTLLPDNRNLSDSLTDSLTDSLKKGKGDWEVKRSVE